MLSIIKSNIHRNQSGASMMEYTLIAALLAVVALTSVRYLGLEIDDTFDALNSNIAGGVESEPTPPPPFGP